MQVIKVNVVQRFGENVSKIVLCVDMLDIDVAEKNLFVYIVVFNIDVFGLEVEDVIFCEAGGGIIVAEKRGWFGKGQGELSKELL